MSLWSIYNILERITGVKEQTGPAQSQVLLNIYLLSRCLFICLLAENEQSRHLTAMHMEKQKLPP